MVKINLLPWREELRQQKQRDFLTAIGLAAALVLSIMAAVHMHIEGLKTHQTARNQLLQSEIDVVDKKIIEIKEIEEKKNKLLVKIELTPWLSAPQLSVIKGQQELSAQNGKESGSGQLSDFTLMATQGRSDTKADAGDQP
ncbi:MAG: hypothetical protein NTV00_04595 [Methylococcales bacterium]|nr:hypothetical protein [Methylococcales bacterium]